jgi:hypothetical protein
MLKMAPNPGVKDECLGVILDVNFVAIIGQAVLRPAFPSNAPTLVHYSIQVYPNRFLLILFQPLQRLNSVTLLRGWACFF